MPILRQIVAPSRQVRQKRPVTPVKVTKRRASSSSSSSLSGLSDDDGYSGVEAISDSEDEEEDVAAAEEEHIISDNYSSSTRPPIETKASPQTQPAEEEEEEDGDDEDEADDEEEEQEESDSDSEDENASWGGIMSDNEVDEAIAHNPVPEMTVQRRVRFDVPDSDGDSTDTDDEVQDFFPDIFVEQSSLDPTFRREIEHDDDDSSSTHSISFWDFHDFEPSDFDSAANRSISLPQSDMNVFAGLDNVDSTPVDTPMTIQDMSTSFSTPGQSPMSEDKESSDGYESDGDTTEEEDPELIQRRPRKETAEETTDSDGVTLIKPRRGTPRVGRFNLDCSGKKPVAVLNPKTGKIMIYTPQKLQQLDLSPEQFHFPFFDPMAQSSPIMSNSGNLMMGAMLPGNGGLGDWMNTQTMGPPEAFFETVDFGDGVEESSEVEEDDDDREPEYKLSLDDFIEYDDEDSSDDNAEKAADDEDPFATTPVRPNTASSDVNHLLNHLHNNPNIVGTFRRDQANHQLIRNGKATRESLAFSNPYFEGTLRGIRAGRLENTKATVSPVRKHKKTSSFASSPLSTAAQKRKASSEHQWNHKRQRSISDVNNLHI